MTEGSEDADLEQRIATLEESMQALKADLHQSSDVGPFGIPRPPTPHEVLTFTDQAVIPAVIAILQANITMLESIRQAIRLTQKKENLTSPNDSIRTVNDEILRQFDRAVNELQQVVEGTPVDDTARDIIADARELRAELAKRTDAAHPRETADLASKEHSSTNDSIDVSAELDSIKAEIDTDSSEDSNDTSSDEDN